MTFETEEPQLLRQWQSQLQQRIKVQCIDHDDGTETQMLLDCEDVADSTSASGSTASEFDSDDASDEKLKSVGSVFMNLCKVDTTADMPQMQPPPGLFPVRQLDSMHHMVDFETMDPSGDVEVAHPMVDFDAMHQQGDCDATQPYFHGDPSFMQDPEPYLSIHLHPDFMNSHCYGTGFKTGGRRSRPVNQHRDTPWTLIWVSEHAFKQASESAAKVFETLGCKVKRFRTSDKATIALGKKAGISNTILLVTQEQARGMANFLTARGLVEDVPLVVLGNSTTQHGLPPTYPLSIAESCEDALDIVKAIAVQYGFAWA